MKAWPLVAIMMLSLAACSEEDTQSGEAAPVADPTPAQIAFAEDARPDDPGLAALYDRSCASCHALVDSGAPLTGHGAAWKARIDAKGRDGMLVTIKQGLNAMPAMGLCADCSDDEFLALVDFMATDGESEE